MTKKTNKSLRLAKQQVFMDQVPSLVHQFEGSWWFWDEEQAFRFGPFDTEKEAYDGFFGYMGRTLASSF